jgi:hypothetical protein
VWLVCDAVRTSALDIHFDPVTIDISPARGSRRTRGSRCPLGLKLASEKTDGGRVYRIAGGGKPAAIEPDTTAAQPSA